ncbi:MAG TPA: type II toxin-antitoxin system VapC family toxin [Alphaproteobacteria bacterium]
MIVVDASAMLEALLGTPAAMTVTKWLFDPRQTLHAPHLLDVEVAQVIRRYSASGEIDSARGRAALTDLADFPLHRYPHDFLLPRIWVWLMKRYRCVLIPRAIKCALCTKASAAARCRVRGEVPASTGWPERLRTVGAEGTEGSGK